MLKMYIARERERERERGVSWFHHGAPKRVCHTLLSGLVSFLGIKVNISIAYIKKKKYTKYDI
jgi:hypothetical protein